MKSHSSLIALVATAALGLAACGDSGSDGLSKSELASKADAICKTASDASAKLAAPSDFGQADSDPAAAESYLGKLAPITKKEADDLAELKPADDVKSDWDAFVAKEKELSAFLDGVLAKAKAKDPSGVEDLAQAPKLGEEFTAAATKIGADGCAKG